MPHIDIFYGITTTTLVVLSSATLVVFNHQIDSLQSNIKSCENSIKELDNKEKICDEQVLSVLGVNTGSLSLKYENFLPNIVREYLALFLVIFLSAISILLTLLSGVFNISTAIISIKGILSINLLSIIIYIGAFVSLFLNVRKKKHSLKTITAESEMFIKSIDDTNALYRTLNEKSKEKSKKNSSTLLMQRP